MDDRNRGAQEPRAAVIAMPDEIDIANIGRLGAALSSACDSGAALVIADMTGTSFCDASGVRMLVLAHKRAAECGVALHVAVTSPKVRRVLILLGLDEIVPIYSSVDAACRGDQRPNRAPRVG